MGELMELMPIARQVQQNLKRAGIDTVIETDGGVIFVRGLDSKGKAFRIRIRKLLN
jgi:hypothetical protein